VLGILLVVSGVWAASPEVFWDDFNDGLWNGIKWKKATWDDGNFRETGGRCLFYDNGGAGFQVSGWSANFDRVYNGLDYLDIQATVRVPHKIKGGDGNYEIGLGLYESRPLHNYLELTVRDKVDGRFFVIYYWNGVSYDGKEFTYPAPATLNAYRIRIYYSASTDKVNFFWAPVGSTTWTKIRSGLSMQTMFNRTVPHTMRPYFVGYMDLVQVPDYWNVYLDDFIAVYRDLP